MAGKLRFVHMGLGPMGAKLCKLAMEKAVRESIPPGTEDINLKALEAGYLYSQQDKREE